MYKSIFELKRDEVLDSNQLLKKIKSSFKYDDYFNVLFDESEARRSIEKYSGYIDRILEKLKVNDRFTSDDIIEPIIHDLKIEDWMLEIWLNIFNNFLSWTFNDGAKDQFRKIISYIKRYFNLNNLEIIEKEEILKVQQKEVSTFLNGVNSEETKIQIFSYYQYRNNIQEKLKIINFLWKEYFDKNGEIIKQYWGEKYWKELNSYVQNNHIRHNNNEFNGSEDDLDNLFIKMSPALLIDTFKK